ncbi:MAG TPA: phage tail protein [Nakamurella sp.]|jgi:phage tail-like protein
MSEDAPGPVPDGGTGPPELTAATPGDAPTEGTLALHVHPAVGVPASAAGVPVRRGMRVGRPPRSPRWLVDQLPVGMAQQDFFVRFVGIFQELSSTLLEDADLVEHVADATVTPVPMLQALAGWIGVDSVDASLPEDLQRLIVRSSARSLARRGTADGLREFVQMLSGGPATIDDGGGVWREGDAPSDVAWVRIEVQGTGHLTDQEFVALLRDEVPAHVRVELWVAGRRALSTVEDDR